MLTISEFNVLKTINIHKSPNDIIFKSKMEENCKYDSNKIFTILETLAAKGCINIAFPKDDEEGYYYVVIRAKGKTYLKEFPKDLAIWIIRGLYPLVAAAFFSALFSYIFSN